MYTKYVHKHLKHLSLQYTTLVVSKHRARALRRRRRQVEGSVGARLCPSALCIVVVVCAVAKEKEREEKVLPLALNRGPLLLRHLTPQPPASLVTTLERGSVFKILFFAHFTSLDPVTPS